MAKQPLELAGLIKSLRAELARAQAEGEGKAISFIVEEVDLQLEIAAEEAVEGGIAAKFYVLTSHFKASKKDVVTQNIRLKMRPEEIIRDPKTGKKRKRPLPISGKSGKRKH